MSDTRPAVQIFGACHSPSPFVLSKMAGRSLTVGLPEPVATAVAKRVICGIRCFSSW